LKINFFIFDELRLRNRAQANQQRLPEPDNPRAKSFGVSAGEVMAFNVVR
jgi:hypothetical protein